MILNVNSLLYRQCYAYCDETARLASRGFYQSMSTLRSDIYRRKSVCRRLSSVCNVRAPTQPVEIFHNISTPLCTLAIRWPPCKILRRLSQGNSSVGVKRKRIQI